MGVLTKGEEQLPASKRRILAQQKRVIQQALESWTEELRIATKEILDVATKHAPRRN
jgi:hypothetical protein